jgi:hypothetical protein
VAHRCGPAGRLQRVAAGVVIAVQCSELALLSRSARICQTLPIFGTSDVVTVTTFVTGARLDAADRQKAAGL